MKKLGKIKEVDVKLLRNVYLGLEFTFSLNGGESEISSRGKYAANTSKSCNYGTKTREEAYSQTFDYIRRILQEAGVDAVSKLKGMPVEVILSDSGIFSDFRILKEVL